jgi:DHA2 family multidrug resistance protein
MSTATLARPQVPVDVAPAPRAINPWAVALTVTLATFMELLDTSIANVSLPHIAGGLGSSFDEATWVLTSYLVANAVVLPLSAWLSRVFGRKRYYMMCVGLFTITSFLCGIAPTLGFLLLFRVMQGIGGGGLAPVEQAILVDTFPANKRAAAFALYSMAIVTAPAIGPPLGGWITDSFSWRWVFFINVPIGIVSLILSSRLVHDPPQFKEEIAKLRASGKLKIDGLGIGLIAVGFGCLEVVLDRGQIDDWFGSSTIVGLLIAAIVTLSFAVYWEWNHTDPVVELKLLTERNFASSTIFYFLFGFVLFGSTTMIQEILQTLYGYTATDAWSRRVGDYGSCAVYGAAGAVGQSQSQASDHFQLRRCCLFDVVLRQLHSADRLLSLCVCACDPGIRICISVCACERDGVFVSAGAEEQQGFEPYESGS